ncbi:hypothetical protein VNI00_013804 [Paramarasmius palmivorus]|uniref:Uncharacterized protein n=1 Tax=Paramarasmius palmivorus TaxID=297713 RepID=A0AAW0BWC4_9AGAR
MAGHHLGVHKRHQPMEMHLEARFSPTAVFTQAQSTQSSSSTNASQTAVTVPFPSSGVATSAIPSPSTATSTSLIPSQSDPSSAAPPSVTITASAVDAPSFSTNGGAIIGGVLVGILSLLGITSLVVYWMRKWHVNRRAQKSNLRTFMAKPNSTYRKFERPGPNPTSFMVERQRPRTTRSQTDPMLHFRTATASPAPFSKTGRPSLDYEDRVNAFWRDIPTNQSHTDVSTPTFSMAASAARRSVPQPIEPKSPMKARHHSIAPSQFSEYPVNANLDEFPRPPPLSVTPTSRYLRGPDSLMSSNMASPSVASFTSGNYEYGHAI